MPLIYRLLGPLVLLLLALTELSAHPGIGIVRDSKGNVFFTDLEHVWKISASGRVSIAVRNVHTHELYLDQHDNLIGEDSKYHPDSENKYTHRVWKLSPAGTITDIIPTTNGFYKNYGFAQDAAGNSYWIDEPKKTIRKRSPTGKVTTHATGDFSKAHWLTADAQGNLYTTINSVLMQINPNGSRRNIASVPRTTRVIKGDWFTEGRHLFGISTGPSGNLYLADYTDRQVKRITTNGQVTVAATSPAPWAPTGAVATEQGELWVLEYSDMNQVRVRKIDSRKRVTIYLPKV